MGSAICDRQTKVGVPEPACLPSTPLIFPTEQARSMGRNLKWRPRRQRGDDPHNLPRLECEKTGRPSRSTNLETKMRPTSRDSIPNPGGTNDTNHTLKKKAGPTLQQALEGQNAAIQSAFSIQERNSSSRGMASSMDSTTALDSDGSLTLFPVITLRTARDLC
ncbi:hypothetical protein NDU88_002288 [Pleurodeles waltl]|uniref:Uncharacterized protein n=1 Tax=Pleurodeles waltl TaxID=8319 RepID=A0AAV7UV57_PLEWA|nr:hypothetical protein NDU88_002288 [Pleurodeles waltl]